MDFVLLAAGGLAALMFLLRRLPGVVTTSSPAPSSPAPQPANLPAPPPSLAWSPAELAVLVGEIAAEESYGRPALAKAIITVESSWNPGAIGVADSVPRNAYDPGDSIGLMQLKIATARAYVPWANGALELLDAPTNIRAGIRFLADLERKWLGTYGLDGVIQMYNLGETRFRQGERTAGYLEKVRRALRAYGVS